MVGWMTSLRINGGWKDDEADGWLDGRTASVVEGRLQ